MLSAGHRGPAWRGLRRGLLLLGCFALLAWGLLSGGEAMISAAKINGQDHAVATALFERALDTELFGTERPDVGRPGRPKMYMNPGKRRVELRVYGLVDTAAQQRIIGRLNGPLERAVLLRFYEREVLIAGPDGARHRGQENLLREIELR